MYQVLAVMFLLIAVGMFLRVAKFSRNCSSFESFVLYLTFPCLIFRSLQPAQLTQNCGRFLLAYTLISLVFLASYFYPRLLHLKDKPV